MTQKPLRAAARDGRASRAGDLVGDVIVVGAGVFGVSAAIELRRRGHDVLLLDPGPVPHPLAASTDISKVVRLSYGADEDYTALMETAREGWLEWNHELGEELYHETGAVFLSRAAMAPGGFEHDSFTVLTRRGHTPERLDQGAIARRFPAWQRGAYAGGFFHAKAGYAESGRVVAALFSRAREIGVRVHIGHTALHLAGDEARVTGVITREGGRFSAAWTVVAAGAWTPRLVPDLAPMMVVSGHPVFHLAAEPGMFLPPGFPVFTADIGNSGWYGFPFHPREQVIKIANHGVGLRLDPEHDERVVTAADRQSLREFLRQSLPGLAGARVVFTRRCLYCDSLDGHFIIARHPTRSGLCVAAGGSGHGFKFAPVLGPLVADAVLGRDNPALAKFRWRELGPGTVGEEAARHRSR